MRHMRLAQAIAVAATGLTLSASALAQSAPPAAAPYAPYAAPAPVAPAPYAYPPAGYAPPYGASAPAGAYGSPPGGWRAQPAGPAAAVPPEVERTTGTYVGPRFRWMIVPQFVQNVFADGGTSFGAPMIGAEVALRHKTFEYVFALSYASYVYQAPFKSKSDGDLAWEYVDANLKTLWATTDFFWAAPLAGERVEFLYGLGLGMGVMFGRLGREQAKPDGAGGIVACTADASGSGPAAGEPKNYCDHSNSRYGGYEEPSWFSGGQRPVFLPWLAVQTGLRFQIAPRVVTRLDLGWSLYGPVFGLSGAFGT